MASSWFFCNCVMYSGVDICLWCCYSECIHTGKAEKSSKPKVAGSIPSAVKQILQHAWCGYTQSNNTTNSCVILLWSPQIYSCACSDMFLKFLMIDRNKKIFPGEKLVMNGNLKRYLLDSIKSFFPLQAYRTETYQKISKFSECWLVNTSVGRQKVDLRRNFHFDTRIHPEVREFINLFSIYACSPVRFGTIRLKWKMALTNLNT